MATEKEFEQELRILDEIYSELIDGIMNKPKLEDYEVSRVYYENVAARMSKWAQQVNDLKKRLEDREPKRDLKADNRPA